MACCHSKGLFMSQVLLFTDLHIHPHKKKYERLQNCLDVLDWVFETAKTHKVKNILFCGDLFHDRQKMDIPTYQKTFEIFVKHLSVKDRPNVYLLLGNHDLWHYEKWDISSVFPLATIDGVKVVDRPCSLEIDGHEIGFLPYTHNPIEDLKKINIKSKFKILCGHVAVDGAIWNVQHGTTADVSIEHDGDMVKITPDVFDGYDQVFLGHYHAEQRLTDTVEYIGSPLQLSYGEAFQKKHVIIYDLKKHTKEYVRNTFSPEHYPIKSKDLPNIKLENNFVRLMVDDLSSPETVELRNELLKQKPGSLEFKAAPKKTEDEVALVVDAKSILAQSDTMLEKYVETQDIKELKLSKDLLLEIGKEICQKFDSENLD